MRQNRGGSVLGLFLILAGFVGLAVNFGYLRFSVEMVAAIPFLLGCFLLFSVFTGNKDNLFPAALFILISVPLYLTLANYSGQRFWPFWVLAPGLAFLVSSLQGGAYRAMAVPGTIVTGVGLYFLGQEWWDLDWQLALSVGLLAVGVLLLITQRRNRAQG